MSDFHLVKIFRTSEDTNQLLLLLQQKSAVALHIELKKFSLFHILAAYFPEMNLNILIQYKKVGEGRRMEARERKKK